MRLTIAEARKILGEKADKYSDEELDERLDTLFAYSQIVIQLMEEKAIPDSKDDLESD